MRLGVLFALIGGLIVALALRADAAWVRAAGSYLAVSPLVVAAGYLGVGPRVFLKRADGRLSPWSLVLLAPYHLLTALSLWLSALSREPAFHEVAPGVLLGRRPLAHDVAAIRAAGATSLLDVTSELAEAPALRAALTYLCLPVLDTRAPTPAQLGEGAAFIAAQRPRGPVYVHCAMGHGRSATFAAAYLLTVGEAASPEDA